MSYFSLLLLCPISNFYHPHGSNFVSDELDSEVSVSGVNICNGYFVIMGPQCHWHPLSWFMAAGERETSDKT